MASLQGPESGLMEAIRLHNAGHTADAQVLCRSLLDRIGAHPALDQLEAVLSHELGEIDTARRHIDRSLAARPDHAPSLMILALVAQDQHDLAAAEAALTKVLGQQPAHAVALVNLGIVHLDQGRLDDAMRRFGAAWRLRPEAFGRIANALCSSSCGALWLDAATLKRALSAAA